MVGGLLAVPPQSAFHCVNLGEGDAISSISTLQEMPLWENGGYLMFRPEVFDHIEEDCDLIGDVCAPLAKQGQMMAFRHRGFWHPADTVKERTALGSGLPERHQTVDAVGRPRPGPAAGRHRGAAGPARPLRRPVPRPSC